MQAQTPTKRRNTKITPPRSARLGAAAPPDSQPRLGWETVAYLGPINRAISCGLRRITIAKRLPSGVGEGPINSAPLRCKTRSLTVPNGRKKSLSDLISEIRASNISKPLSGVHKVTCKELGASLQRLKRLNIRGLGLAIWPSLIDVYPLKMAEWLSLEIEKADRRGRRND